MGPPDGGPSPFSEALTAAKLGALPAPLAQLGEHQLDKLGVAGSSPARRISRMGLAARYEFWRPAA
ncbi:MAG: hypothetical protein QOI64_1980 [Solirubrobacteraceae bacterium]|nr:hypothetical protein [Solirubrobacteraceae bacterium]